MQVNPSAISESYQKIFEPFLYHDPKTPGYFSLLVRKDDGGMKQDTYRLKLMPDVIRALDRRRDTYLTQNEFFRPNRRVANLLQINVVWVELDTYNVPSLREYSPEGLSHLVLDYCQEHQIPLPSLVLFSGQGLHVKWLLDKPIPRQALPRWNAVQRHLSKKFELFGADFKGIDASRVLRLEQTVNTKSREVCRILWTQQGNDGPADYDFDLLADEILPFTRDQLTEIRDKAAARGIEPKHFERRTGRGIFTAETLHWTRIEDLREIARIRGWTNGNPDGQRYPFIFYGAISLSWLVPPVHWYREIEALARQFAPGWPTNKIREHVPRVYMDFKQERVIDGQGQESKFRYTNQKIMDQLQVTPDEERHLKVLISQDEKRRRQREAKERQRRAQGMAKREEYEARARERREKALDLRQRGLSFNQIATELGTSRRHIIRLIQG